MSQSKGQLPRPIFAKIAPHEYLVANLSRESPAGASLLGSGKRPNGRSPSEARSFDVHTGSLSQAHGSAAVRLDRTRVVCGVRAEILPVENIPQYRPSSIHTSPPSGERGARDERDEREAEKEADNRRQLRDYDLLVPNLELATGSAPEFLPGGPPSVLAQSLSTRLYALLHSSGLVDAEPLKIWHQPEKTVRRSADDDMDVDEEDREEDEEDEDDARPELKAYWTLYIDLLFLSFDGNPFDAAWAAVVAALRNTRLPSAHWDADRGVVALSKSKTGSAASLPLALRGLPVSTTAAVCVENKKKQRQQRRQGLQRHESRDEEQDGTPPSGGARWILLDPDRLEENQCGETATVVVDRSSGATVVRALSKTGGLHVGPRELRALVEVAEERWQALADALRAVQS